MHANARRPIERGSRACGDRPGGVGHHPETPVVRIRVVPRGTDQLPWSRHRKGRVGAETFEIVVRGRLSPTLVAALEGFEVSHCDDGLTHLVGWVPDQARLHSVLELLRDLNIELASVNPAPAASEQAAAPRPARPHPPKGTPVTDISRSNLPIPHRHHVGLTTYDAKDPDTSFPPIEPLRPPNGAPNVVVIMLDDTGFGASVAFGGPCQTPVAERLAANGLAFNRFHTTALCSPTRAALLTARNHHSVGMGGITEIATSAPGYNSVRPDNAAPIAETLRLNGYSTAQFGKCHEVPGVGDQPHGPVRPVADRQRLRALLRLRGRRRPTSGIRPCTTGPPRWSRPRPPRRATTSPRT